MDSRQSQAVLSDDAAAKLPQGIVFCTDARYAPYLAVLIYSIALHSSLPLRFLVLYSSLDNDSTKLLTELCRRLSADRGLSFAVEFIQVNAEELLKSHGLQVETFRGCYDPYTRLFLTEILAGRDLDKLIYLDVDMLCRGDIAELMQTAAGINTFGGVLDTVSLKLDYKLLTPTYINSGLLILSLSYLRSLNFIERCAAFIQEHAADFACPDQDIINNVIPAADLVLVDQKFNQYLPSRSLVRQALILHYTGPYKPWMADTRWRYKKVCWQAYRLCLRLYLRGFKFKAGGVERVLKLMSALRVFFNLKLTLRQLILGKKTR